MGQGERIPTLRDVIALIDKRMLINIEVKTPFSAEVKQRYDYKKAVRKIHSLIVEADAINNCCVSSFDEDALEEFYLLNR